MNINMDGAISDLKRTTLADLSTRELQLHRREESFHDRYGVEILRHALIEQSDEAWSAFEECFSGTVRVWLRSHPYSDVALRRDSEENYIARTFTRFWYAVRDQHLALGSLPAILRYLHATLNGLLTDTLRSHLRQCTREVSLPQPGCPEEPGAEDPLQSERLWEGIQKLLVNQRERRLFFLLYGCGLKPRQVVVRCPQEFSDVKEIYRLNANIIERLRRNRDRLSYFCEGDV